MGGGILVPVRPSLHTTIGVNTTRYGVNTKCTKLGGDSTQDRPDYGSSKLESDNSD